MAVRDRRSRVLGWISVAAAAVAAVLLAVAPTGTSTSVSTRSDGVVEPTVVRHRSLLDAEGPSVLIALAIPVVLTAAGALVAGREGSKGVVRLLAGLLVVFCLLGAASIGLFFLPAAVLLAIAGR